MAWLLKICSIVAFLCAIMHFQSSQAQINVAPCVSQNWVGCAAAIGSTLFKSYYRKWSGGTITIGGFQCIGSQSGGFYRWKWRYNGKFTCPTLHPTITGTSSNKASKGGAIEWAITDYMDKIKTQNLLTPDQWTAMLNDINAYAAGN